MAREWAFKLKTLRRCSVPRSPYLDSAAIDELSCDVSFAPE
jgi:hypothetical protein